MCCLLCSQTVTKALSAKWKLSQWYSKAFFAMTVSSEDVPVMRCTYQCLEKWSPKMVAALYLFLVSFPLNWAMIPTCVLIIWSTDTHSPGFIVLKMGLPSLWDSFICHGFLSWLQKDIQHMLVAWPWRDTWGFHLTLLITAACQMRDVWGGSAIVSVQLFFICLRCCLVLNFIGWWIGIKGKRAHLILRW